MGLALGIAVRFLKTSKGQTVLIALGIAVGVSVQIFIGLLIQGLQQSLIDRTIGSSSQITVTSENENRRIEGWEEKLERIRSVDDRILHLSVAADAPAFLKEGEEGSVRSVLVRGLLLEKAEPLYDLRDKLYEGSLPDQDGQAMVGRELGEELGLKTGDGIEIVTAGGGTVSLDISGFYDFKVSSINQSWVIVNLKTSQDMFGFESDVTSMEMQVREVFQADEIADSIRSQLADSGLKTVDWESQNQQLLSGLNGQSVSSIMIQVFVLIAVVLGISSVLAISVLQKSRQIGILKAMGLKDRNSSLVFLFQGLLLGVIGGILGILLGVGLLWMFSTFAVNSDGTPVVEIGYNYGFIAFSGIVALLSAVIASLIPARRSSKLSPIEVIKNG